jgi:hypothetical protein
MDKTSLFPKNTSCGTVSLLTLCDFSRLIGMNIAHEIIYPLNWFI